MPGAVAKLAKLLMVRGIASVRKWQLIRVNRLLTKSFDAYPVLEKCGDCIRKAGIALGYSAYLPARARLGVLADRAVRADLVVLDPPCLRGRLCILQA